MTDEIVVRGFSLTRVEMGIIDKVSQERALFNSSAALRQIIREWQASQVEKNQNGNEKAPVITTDA